MYMNQRAIMKPKITSFRDTIALRDICIVLLGVVAGPIAGLQAQTLPALTPTTTKQVAVISGNAGHVGANSFGDGFYISQGDGNAYWLKYGATTPVSLVSGLTQGSQSIHVDSANNVYIPANYSGDVIEVPYVNGGYATGTASGNVTAECTPAPTVPCLAFTSGSFVSTALTNGYYQPTDLGFDAAGNVYIVDEHDNVNSTSNSILKFAPAGVNGSGYQMYNVTLVVGGLAQSNSGQIAVDAIGDVYYSDSFSNGTGSKAYAIPVGSTSATPIGTGVGNAAGVAVDKYGNLFVTDSSTKYSFYEFPALNGVAQLNQQFTAFYGYSANSIAFDGLGHYYYTAYSGGTTLDMGTIWGFDFGRGAIGPSLGSQTISVTFAGTYTPATISFNGASPSAFSYSAGSSTPCTASAVNAGANCNVTVSYTPTAVGLQRGSLVFADANGNQIAAIGVSGTGIGSEQTVDPGTISAIGANWASPQGIAVDPSGAVYVADTAANSVYRFASASSTTSTTVGSGLTNPEAVVVDAAGNVYIADAGNTNGTNGNDGRIMEVPIVNGALSTAAPITIYKGISNKVGLAMDRFGDLYIADSGNSRVLELLNTAGVPNGSDVSIIGSGFKTPLGIAVDGSSNVYVADATANSVTEIVAVGGSLVTVGAGYSAPSGLAVDSSGSVYVADSGNFRLIKIPLENGAFNANDSYSLGGTIVQPSNVAIDGAANLYVIDSSHAAVSQLLRTQGLLPLGRANTNTTSSQLVAEIGSAGNAPLVLGNPAYTASGNTAEFAVTSPSIGGCTNSESISSGFACSLAATFTPPASASYTENLAFSSNAANTSSPQLTLTGTGLFLANTTVTLAQTAPAGQPVLGQPVTIAATIGFTANGSAVPSGTVTFYVDNQQYGQPMTVASNQASITITGLSGGTHNIGASYSGDNNYAPSAATAFPLTLGRASSSVTYVFTPGSLSSNPTSAAPGASIGYQATVVPSYTAAPTGTVSFYAGSVLIGTAGVQTQGQPPVSQASLTTTNTPAGNDSITAVYSGDVNYLPSTSAAQVVLITPAAFTLTPSTSTMTLTSGQTGTLNFTVTSYSGYTNATIGLTCSGLPANSQCSFSPNNFTLVTSVPQAVTALVITGQVPVIPSPVVGSLHYPWGGSRVPFTLALLAFVPLGLFRRRFLRGRLANAISMFAFAILAGGLFAALTGCGNTLTGKTPTGSYAVTVTAYSTAGTGVTTTQQATIALTVK